MATRYAHTNLISHDWRRLAEFYCEVLDCEILQPERNMAGEWLENLTGIPDASLQGAHLRLPGYGEAGPTLEIFSYAEMEEKPGTAANRKGIAHLAFAVDDVAATLELVLGRGGGTLGTIESVEIVEAGTVTLVYATDPDGNILELQKWDSYES